MKFSVQNLHRREDKDFTAPDAERCSSQERAQRREFHLTAETQRTLRIRDWNFFFKFPLRSLRVCGEMNLNSPRSQRLGGKTGFTFLEVLFAVIILGVGFIMLAGLFPAAISQTQSNVAETAATSVGRDALRDIQSAVNNYQAPPATGTILSLLPPTDNPVTTAFPNLPITSAPIMPIPNEIVQVPNPGAYFGYSTALGATPMALPTANPNYNLTNTAIVSLTHVSTTDPRFGWVGFYRRDWISVNGAAIPSPYAQVWILAAQSTAEGQPTFGSSGPLYGTNNVITGTLAIVPITGTTLYNSYLELPTTGTVYATPSAVGSPAVPNAFALVISTGDSGLLGQVVRLGSIYGTGSTANTTFWSLLPGSDLNPSDTNLNNLSNPTTLTGGSTALTLGGGGTENVTVFILGSPFNAASSTYQGPAQDITCTSGFIRVSN
jgi:type II secretory pathway pseudopilin PulG